jgi:hypothetical protein
MATSGTYGQTVFTIATVIEQAFRAATGLSASAISAEDLEVGRNSLYLGATALSNRGLSLWCIRNVTLPCVVGQAAYILPIGTENIDNMTLRRPLTRTAADTLSSGSAVVTFADAVQVNNVDLGLPASSGTWVVEASADNVTWTECGRQEVSLAAAGRGVIDLDPQPVVRYWRARQLVATVTPTSCHFCQGVYDVTGSKLSRDDYFNLPNKSQRGLPLQFWFDKQVAPRIVLWQVPDQESYQIGCDLQFRVQDPGDFNLNLQVPDRWLDAVIWDLSWRMYSQLPRDRVNPNMSLAQLQGLAEAAIRSAEDSETDGAPVRIMPAIGYYTE